MTDPTQALRALLEQPPFQPPPVEELHRRVGARRRRRTRRRLVLAGLATIAALAAAVPFVRGPTDGAINVAAGPDYGPGGRTTEFRAGVPYGTRLDFHVPEGWETLFAEGERMVVATRPLSEGDRALALLARNDVSFTAFPADGVVVVVGGDPLQGKYGTGQDGATLDPGPAYALGDERVLAGGVRVRRGDVPQSIVRVASYAGPSAPAARLREAEGIAAGVRLVATGDPAVRPPPPPVGSRPGMDGGPLPVAEQGLPEVARAPAGGSVIVLVAGRDCGYLRSVDSQPSVPGHQPLAGACGPRPTGPNIEALGRAVMVMRGPYTSSTAVIFRAGPEVRSVSARLADGRSVPAVMGADGWGLAAAPEGGGVVGSGSVAGSGSETRIVALHGLDAQGRRAPETLVR